MGRPRHDSVREPNGRARRMPRKARFVRQPDDGPTPERKAQREHLVGDNERKQRYASYPLGVLYARRMVISAEHYAGRRYAQLFVRGVRPARLLSILASLSASTPALEMSLYDRPLTPDERQAEDLDDYLLARAALWRRGAYVTEAVNDLVLYEQAPLTMKRVELAREGLAALHAHFEESDAQELAAVNLHRAGSPG